MWAVGRYFIEISYEGTKYHGWQTQPNGDTVQERLDKALRIFFRQPIETLGCGRTDAGVHATEFFAHFDMPEVEEQVLAKSVDGLNALLPYDIGVKRVFKVHDEAHARFDATSRKYHYFINFHKDPFLVNRSWLYKLNLDVEAMNEAAQALLGFTDFTSFSKAHAQTFTNNCKLMEARFERTANGLQFVIKADRFLRNMVRAIVGTLVRVGKGEIGVEEVKKIVESKNRGNAGQSVPACGLYLVAVDYPFIDKE